MRHTGIRQRIKIDVKDPRGLAICDGCGLPTMHYHLREKKEYRGGMSPVGTGLMVCAQCDDVPQPYFQRQVLRPDPVPLVNPRPDDHGDADIFPTYTFATLPDPRTLPAGYRINVTLSGTDTPAYSDGENWRDYVTGAVVVDDGGGGL